MRVDWKNEKRSCECAYGSLSCKHFSRSCKNTYAGVNVVLPNGFVVRLSDFVGLNLDKPLTINTLVYSFRGFEIPVASEGLLSNIENLSGGFLNWLEDNISVKNEILTETQNNNRGKVVERRYTDYLNELGSIPIYPMYGGDKGYPDKCLTVKDDDTYLEIKTIGYDKLVNSTGQRGLYASKNLPRIEHPYPHVMVLFSFKYNKAEQAEEIYYEGVFDLRDVEVNYKHEYNQSIEKIVNTFGGRRGLSHVDFYNEGELHAEKFVRTTEE